MTPAAAPATHLDEALLLASQQHMTMENQQRSVLAGVLVGAVVLATLSNHANQPALSIWLAVLVLVSLALSLPRRRYLAAGADASRNRERSRFLVVNAVLVSGTWGALAWVTLGHTQTVAESVLAIAVMAGVLSNAMANHSALFRLFALFCTIEVGLASLRLWYLGDTAFRSLGLTVLLYLGTLVGQARNSARVTRAMLELRFQNTELVARLRTEADAARTARRDAEDANLAKSRFLAAASHDLRQPVHAQGLLLAALGHTDLAPEQHRMLENATSAARASAEMLDTLLDFSRIEAGVVRPSPQPFALQPLLHRIENELGPQADAQGLVYRSPETGLAAVSDPMLVELVLRNLVSNAIRYTRRGGLLVACRRRGGLVCLEVWDTGIGIAQDQQQAIFREFHQLGNAERDRRKGLGLGLAIVQGLCRALGHEVSVRSRVGRGSVFRVFLPMARLAMPAAGDPAQPRQATDARLEGLAVLVIDDDESVRAAMHALLRQWGCGCRTAESPDEALASARERRPDLVLCDYRLRGRTGAEVIAALRQELGGDLPALLVTGDTAPERLREAVASGIPLLHKPVPAERLHRHLLDVCPSPRPASE